MTKFRGLASVGVIALVGAALVGSGTLIGASYAQDAPKAKPFPAFSFLRGANVPVRGVTETEFTDRTKKVPIEVYRDEDFGSVVMVTGDGDIAALPQPPIFQVKTLGVDEDLVAVRFMPRSGATWVMEDMKWVPVTEAADAPTYLGDYDVQMVETDGVIWYVRSDSITGRTWVMGRDDAAAPPNWVYTADPDLDAAQ